MTETEIRAEIAAQDAALAPLRAALLVAARAHDDQNATTLACLVTHLAEQAADGVVSPLHGALPLLRDRAEHDADVPGLGDPLLAAFCDAADAFLTEAT